MPPSTDSASPPLQRLRSWLKSAGADCEAIDVRDEGNGERGLCARSTVPAGTAALRIPAPLLITLETARASNIGRAIADRGVALGSPFSEIAAFLIQELDNPGSVWKPFLETLPASFANVPVYFTPDEMDLLQGSFVRRTVQQRRAALRAEHERLRTNVAAFADVGYDRFLWAWTAVATRNFEIEVNGGKTAAMVPLADILNHRMPPETHWNYDEESRAFVLTAMRGFAAGEPLHTSYGAKGNSRLLLNYGFCLAANDHDEAALQLALPGQPAQTFQVQPDYGAAETRRMFGFLRRGLAGHPEPVGEAAALPISVQNETLVLLSIAAACQGALEAFGSTIEEDDRILADPALSIQARNCVLARRGEKTVLHRFLGFVQLAVAWLRQTTPDREAAAALGLTPGPFAGYASEILEAFANR